MSDVQFSVSLPPDAVQQATTQALMGILSPEVKEQLLQKAINAILCEKNSYRDKKTLLECAFEDAVAQVAREEAVKMVKDDEQIRSKLQAVLRDTADKVLSTSPEQLAEKMAASFISSIRRADY